MFQKIKSRLTGAVENTVSPSREHISGIRADMDARLRGLRADRDTTLQAALEEDFARVCTAWGIPPDGLANAIRLLRLRMVVFCVPIILAAKLVYQSDEGGAISLAASALLLICACVGLLTTCWRLTVLRFRHFVPFRRWLLSALFVRLF